MKGKVKRALSILLAVGLLLTCVVGCSQNNPSDKETSTPDVSAETTPGAAGELVFPEGFPKKEIKIVVPYAAGGAYDTMARLIQEVAKRDYNVDIVVENVTGGSGAVGATQVLTSKPDGYTVGLTSGTFVSHIATGKVGSKLEDMTPLCSLTEDPVVLVTKPGRYDTMEEFIQAMKDNPDKIQIAVPGFGSANNAFAQVLCDLEGGGKVINLESGSRIATELMGEHVDAGSLKPNDALSQLASGQLQMICTFGKERMEAYPDVPTAEELGIDVYPYGDGCRLYVFMMAPSGLDPEVQSFLEQLFVLTSQSEDFQKLAQDGGCEANAETGDTLNQHIQEIYDLAPILEEEIFSKAGL